MATFNITHLNNLDVVNANAVDQGLFLDGVLITATAAEINAVADLGARNTQVATATVTLTAADNRKVLLLNRAAGAAVTLPAATGSGIAMTFVVQASAATGNYVIKVANASDTMIGMAQLFVDAGAVNGYACAAASDTLTMNGTTTGGLVGAYVTIKDVAANKWQIAVVSAGSGTLETPFSATVA